jgi:hypothetical protein
MREDIFFDIVDEQIGILYPTGLRLTFKAPAKTTKTP